MCTSTIVRLPRGQSSCFSQSLFNDAPPPHVMENFRKSCKKTRALARKTFDLKRRSSVDYHHHHHHEQIIVQHNYHDRSHDLPPPSSPTFHASITFPDASTSSPSASTLQHYDWNLRTTATTAFPLKLYEMLDQIDRCSHSDKSSTEKDESYIVSWQPHGRCFAIRNAQAFREILLPRYFPKLSKVTSFQRQLNLYGFQRITQGLDKGSYYHELFLRGKPYLAFEIQRIKIKGTGVRAKSNPEQEPDFWSMEWVGTPCSSQNKNNTEDAYEIASDSQPMLSLSLPKMTVKVPTKDQTNPLTTATSHTEEEENDFVVAPSMVTSSSASSFMLQQDEFVPTTMLFVTHSVISQDEQQAPDQTMDDVICSEHLVLPMSNRDMEVMASFVSSSLPTQSFSSSSSSWLFAPTDVVLTEWGMPFHALDALPDDLGPTHTPPPSRADPENEEEVPISSAMRVRLADGGQRFVGELDDQLYMKQVLHYMVDNHEWQQRQHEENPDNTENHHCWTSTILGEEDDDQEDHDIVGTLDTLTSL